MSLLAGVLTADLASDLLVFGDLPLAAGDLSVAFLLFTLLSPLATAALPPDLVVEAPDLAA